MAKSEHQKAREWRERRGWSQAQLAEMTGYSYFAVRLMELGINSEEQPVSPYVWQRYKMACAGVEAQAATSTQFGW